MLKNPASLLSLYESLPQPSPERISAFSMPPLTSEEKAKWRIWGDTESQTAELHLPLLLNAISLSRGLVLHLPFLHSLKDSSDKLNQSHARGFPGQVSYVADRMNIANQAIRLEGQQGFIQVMDADVLDPIDAFSLALWTHIDGLNDPKVIGGFLLNKWNSSPTSGDYILRIQSDGKLALTVSNNDPIFNQDFLVSPASVPLNKWVHLAATFSKGKLVLYVNGKAVADKISTTVLTLSNGEYSNDDIQIGGLWNNHYLFRGKIDDVRIYDRTLSPQELDLLHFESQEHDLIESTNSYGTPFEAE